MGMTGIYSNGAVTVRVTERGTSVETHGTRVSLNDFTLRSLIQALKNAGIAREIFSENIFELGDIFEALNDGRHPSKVRLEMSTCCSMGLDWPNTRITKLIAGDYL